MKFYLLVYFVILSFFNLRDIVSTESENLLTKKHKKISDDEMKELIEDALEGLRQIIIDGDDELRMDPMEPYRIDDELLWYYDDVKRKDRVYIASGSPTFLFGLSSFIVKNVIVNMSELDAEITLKFDYLRGIGKYNAKGYIFNKLIPVVSKGRVEAKAEDLVARLFLNLSLTDSRIVVEETSLSIRPEKFHVKASNIYSIPATYTTPILNEVLKRAYKRYKKDIDDEINEELWDIAEMTFSGMKMSELIDFLKYLAKKGGDLSDSTLRKNSIAQNDVAVANNFNTR